MDHKPELFASGFSWPEAPRWHDECLWISDVHNFRIAAVNGTGAVRTALDIPERPAGMDFQADGHLLLGTSLKDTMLSCHMTTGEKAVVADLTGQLAGNFNDMITAKNGWSWIGDTGFTFGVDDPVCKGKIYAYHPDHGARVVAEDVFFPNGMVISADEKSVFVSETFGKKISVFDIGEDGGLLNSHVHSQLPGHPDGLCASPSGDLWVPLLMEEKFVRVGVNGDILDEINFPGRMAIACIYGGADGADLFLCTAEVTSTKDGPRREGTVHVIRNFA